MLIHPIKNTNPKGKKKEKPNSDVNLTSQVPIKNESTVKAQDTLNDTINKDLSSCFNMLLVFSETAMNSPFPQN